MFVDEFISVCGNALKFSNEIHSIDTDIFSPGIFLTEIFILHFPSLVSSWTNFTQIMMKQKYLMVTK